MTTVLLFAAASFAMIIAVLTWLKATKVESFYPQKPVSKFKIRSNRAVWLSQARVNMTPEEFWLITLLCGSAVFLLVLLFSKTPLVALAIGVGSTGIPYSFIAKKRTHTSKELINAWPEALRDISSTISAGHSLSFSLHTLAKVGPDPISPHMARFQILERSVVFVTALEIVRE